MAEEQTKMPRGPRLLLVASLALNLLVVGLVVGTLATSGKSGGPPRFDLTAGPLTRAMEGDRREAVRDALRESGAFRNADRSGMRADVLTLLTTLRAEEFDEAAFLDALTRQRTRLQSGQDAVLAAVTQQINDMSPQERAAFADRLEEQMRRATPRRQ